MTRGVGVPPLGVLLAAAVNHAGEGLTEDETDEADVGRGAVTLTFRRYQLLSAEGKHAHHNRELPQPHNHLPVCNETTASPRLPAGAAALWWHFLLLPERRCVFFVHVFVRCL